MSHDKPPPPFTRAPSKIISAWHPWDGPIYKCHEHVKYRQMTLRDLFVFSSDLEKCSITSLAHSGSNTSSGTLWCFYQLFGRSFWRHPFTAEHPLVSKWCNATFLQIWRNVSVNLSLSVRPDWCQWLSEVAKDSMFLFIPMSIIWDEFLLWIILISQALAYSTTLKFYCWLYSV